MNEQKIALITGANRGIGYAIAQGLLEANFRVIIGSRSFEKGKTAAKKLNSNLVSVVEIDIADDDSIDRAFKEVSDKISSLDVLINNAGIFPDNGFNILTIERDLLIKTFNVNTFGAIRVTQKFLPLLEKANAARIINYSSGYGQLAELSAGVPSYCLSKLAVNGTTIMLADALHSKNISVNSVDPGWVSSDMGGENAPRTVEKGADTAVWLATAESIKDSGKLWRDRAIVSF